MTLPLNAKKEKATKEKATAVKSFQLLKANREIFVQTLSEQMQPFSLETVENNPFQVDVASFQLSSLGLVRIRSNQGFSIQTEPNPLEFKLDIAMGGQLIDDYSNTSFLPYESAFLPELGEPVKLTLGNSHKNTDTLCSVFNPEQVRSFAEKLSAGLEDSFDLRFPRNISLCTAEGQSFLRYLNYLYREIETNSPILQSPLILAQLQDTAISMFLYVSQPEQFSPNASNVETAQPSYIRRAEAYIRACVADPISMADISRSVGVHSRTLFKGFREYLNTTPMAYLKARRLEKVRQELLTADPTCAHVTDIAMKWGFSNLGHFAADYRKAFGELPSETLR